MGDTRVVSGPGQSTEDVLNPCFLLTVLVLRVRRTTPHLSFPETDTGSLSLNPSIQTSLFHHTHRPLWTFYVSGGYGSSVGRPVDKEMRKTSTGSFGVSSSDGDGSVVPHFCLLCHETVP